MAKAVTKIALSKKKRKAFLVALAETGQVTKAARAVGYTNTSFLHRMRRNDEAFAEEWKQAEDAAGDFLIEEARRRAVEGVLEPIYYKGEVAGYKTNHSDALLMFIIRGLRPETYRDSQRGGDTNINFGIAVLPMTAPNEQAWEQRAVEMHEGQEIITLEAKPVENNMMTVKRSD